MSEPFVPDLSSRPFSMTVERQMNAAAELLYDAWDMPLGLPLEKYST